VAEELLHVAEREGDPSGLVEGHLIMAPTSFHVGNFSRAELEEGVARWQPSGSRLAAPFLLSLLASALDRVGRRAEALNALGHALACAEHTDERWFACELYILKAALTARTGHRNGRGHPRVQARRALRRAMQLAGEMGSPSLRLRAANALSPLLREQGKASEARELVGSAYAAFSEGFETTDLAEAQAMLAEL